MGRTYYNVDSLDIEPPGRLRSVKFRTPAPSPYIHWLMRLNHVKIRNSRGRWFVDHRDIYDGRAWESDRTTFRMTEDVVQPILAEMLKLGV